MDNRKLALALIVPAVILMATSHRRSHALWQDGGSPEGRRHGYGGHGPGRWASRAGERNLPPMLEAMLDRWHTAAHAAGSIGEATESI